MSNDATRLEMYRDIEHRVAEKLRDIYDEDGGISPGTANPYAYDIIKARLPNGASIISLDVGTTGNIDELQVSYWWQFTVGGSQWQDTHEFTFSLSLVHQKSAPYPEGYSGDLLDGDVICALSKIKHGEPGGWDDYKRALAVFDELPF